MKKRLIIILAVIVLLPLGVLVWLGASLAQREQQQAELRYRRVLLGRLEDVRSNMAGIVKARERELLRALDLPDFKAQTIRARVRTERLLRQIFILGSDCHLIYPAGDIVLSSAEQDFLRRTQSLWDNGEPFWQPDETTPVPAAKSGGYRKMGYSRRGKLRRQTAIAPAYGWHVWFWGDGLRLIFWERRPDGVIIGAEVSRAAILSDIIGELPAGGATDSPLSDGRIVLVDTKGSPIYQWGGFEPPKDAVPVVALNAPAPFSSWRLRYYVPGEAALFSGSVVFNLVVGLGALALAMSLLAIYFYRESSRDMREAARRVTFVNQVSHELKTPLTNIRMYAELLQQRLPESEDGSRNYAGVIVAETGRLSRLINNVLAFAKERRDKLRLHPRAAVPDDVIRATAEAFGPALAALGIRIELDLAAQREMMLDVDKIEQIVGNLLSNVEKYAKGAGKVSITTRQDGEVLTVIVADDGPGIAAKHQELIFEPFTRLSNKLTDGVSGTGLGLAIARRLARLHGGDLVLEPEDSGAAFKLTIVARAAGRGVKS